MEERNVKNKLEEVGGEEKEKERGGYVGERKRMGRRKGVWEVENLEMTSGFLRHKEGKYPLKENVFLKKRNKPTQPSPPPCCPLPCAPLLPALV